MGSMQIKTRSQDTLIYQYKECVHITQVACIAESGWHNSLYEHTGKIQAAVSTSRAAQWHVCERNQNVKQIYNKNSFTSSQLQSI
jgi:hypothetical protein